MLSGEKTVESRLSKTNRAPFERVATDDIVLVKDQGMVYGYFSPGIVVTLEGDPLDVQAVKNTCGKSVCAPDEYWESKEGAKFGTLFSLLEVVKLDEPFREDGKKYSQGGWHCDYQPTTPVDELPEMARNVLEVTKWPLK